MGCLGVHYAIDESDVEKLKSFSTESEMLEYFLDEIEERFFEGDPAWFQETDKAWDGIHRSLTDGDFCDDNGEYPLNQVILGGEELYTQSDHLMFLKTPIEVQQIAAALKDYTKESLRAGYSQITEDNCDWPTSDEDFAYTWYWFELLCGFYQRAAVASKYVVFSATQ